MSKDVSFLPQINLAKDPPLLKVFEPLIIKQLRDEAREQRERKNWHASDLGYCISGTYYDRLADKKDKVIDDNTLMTFAIGHLAHNWLEGTAENAKIIVAKEDALRVKDKVLNASGRADLIIEVGGQLILYDIKTVHPGAFYWNEKRGWIASEHHQQQIHFYYDRLKKKYGKDLIMGLIYVSKDFSKGLKLQEVFVQYDPEITRKNEQYFLTLQKAWKDKKAPKPEEDVVFNEDKGVYEINWKSKYCNYHHLCTGNPDWQKEADRQVREFNRQPR